jgi:putative glutamine amidotransferase
MREKMDIARWCQHAPHKNKKKRKKAMEKPLIGLVPSSWDGSRHRFMISEGYMRWVARAGGLPVMLHYEEDPGAVAAMAARLDGVVFTGGPDIAPSYYGELPTPGLGGIVPQRDRAEDVLFRAAVTQRGLPALGICKGMQVLNVFLGGSLYQDIGADYPGKAMLHDQGSEGDVATHTAAVTPGTPLHALLGDTIRINSYHHQAVKTLAPGLRVMATAPDGIIEAYDAPDRPFLWGVQFHPELLAADNIISAKIFGAFVAACAK